MNENKMNGWVGGMILIGIGLVALAGQIFDIQLSVNLGLFILPILGAIFVLWGILTRNVGPLIPGGILSGLGLGIILVETISWPANVDDGGIFLLAFSLGWALITVLTAVFTDKTHWWPLIPGGILALIGLAVLFGGAFWQALNLMNLVWPVLLIVLGLSVIFHARKTKEKSI